MNFPELQEWIVGPEGLGPDLMQLRRDLAVNELSTPAFTPGQIAFKEKVEWRRLLLAASVLAHGAKGEAQEQALLVAQAAVQSGDKLLVDSGAVILDQLANARTVQLAQRRGLIEINFRDKLGATAQLLEVRRSLLQGLYLRSNEVLSASQFQRELWDGLTDGTRVSATAPTSAGKTFIALQWLLNQYASNAIFLSVFIAPTRALVGEIERSLLDLAAPLAIPNLRVSSLPIRDLADLTRPTILVFTQERLHVFLNGLASAPPIDALLIDEGHKLGDGLRGVVLQDAIDRALRSGTATKVIYLTPMSQNPEVLLADAGSGERCVTITSDAPTVTQHLFLVDQRPRDATDWDVTLRYNGEEHKLGQLRLHARPDNQRKRLSYTALAIGRNGSGTLVYANGADEAEKLAWQIFDDLDDSPVAPELGELAEFARETIHPEFQLIRLLSRGVAFHYGNMPTLLRSEIERLFSLGLIRFLVCTSTLIEGVNIACQTIVVRGPRKGNRAPMNAQDFWNLAGRAGRWGQDLTGNVVCVDSKLVAQWPTGVPRRAKYPIIRETDAVLRRQVEVLEFLDSRSGAAPESLDVQLEQVVAYLLGIISREGTIRDAYVASKLEPGFLDELERRLKECAAAIDLPASILTRHSGVSPIALQSLLAYMRTRDKPAEELLPAAPESSDAREQMIAVFRRIHDHMFPAFIPNQSIPVLALVTVQWMRGYPLGQIIRDRMRWLTEKGRKFTVAAVIRDTMRDVEEVARFRAPKYIAAYMDVLRFHLEELGRPDLLEGLIDLDIYLEFGVATKTMISMIGLGLSRASALAVNEYLGSDELDEPLALARLADRRWNTVSIPALVRREIEEVLRRRTVASVA